MKTKTTKEKPQPEVLSLEQLTAVTGGGYYYYRRGRGPGRSAN